MATVNINERLVLDETLNHPGSTVLVVPVHKPPNNHQINQH